MFATKREKCIYGNDVEIIDRHDDCTVYRISDEVGEVKMTSYRVFPGIELIYNDAHTARCRIEKTKLVDIIEINHCREGRIECEFKDEFYYLSPGDLSIAKKDDTGHGSHFPLSHYHGITIRIDVAHAPDCLSCFLEDVTVDPNMLTQKFCNGDQCFIARAVPQIEHIFSELYDVPESIRRGYFKVKILELLLFLSSIEVSPNQTKQVCIPKTHVTLAKEICQHLTEHMDCRITLEQLSSIFHVSGTQIKNSFKSVYGISIYTYIRTQKMQSAALLLKDTDNTILEIAGKYGYDNGSKFAKAFRDVMGVTPNEYRNIKEKDRRML